MNKKLIQIIEGLLYLSGDKGITIGEFILTTNYSQHEIEESLKTIEEKYSDEFSPFTLLYTSNSYKIATKESLHTIFEKYANLETNNKITTNSLETLAIIAYNQPITKYDIEQLKGTNVSYHIKQLVMKNLIYPSGILKEIGNPKIYSTSEFFLDFIGINTLNDLPPLKDFSLNISENELFSYEDLNYKELSDKLLKENKFLNLDTYSDEKIKILDTLDVLEINEITKNEEQ